MKTRTLTALACAMALVAAPFAHAGDFYWSSDGTTLGGNGTWDTSNGRWGTTVAGPFSTIWNNSNNDTGIFSSRIANTVTLGTGITVGGLQFNIKNYTITGNTLTFGDGEDTVTLKNVDTATISSAISGGVSANVTFTQSNPGRAGTLTFSSASAGGWSGTTTVNAPMTLTSTSASGVKNYVLQNTSAITLNGGSIVVNRAYNAAGEDYISDSAPITVNGGGTLNISSINAGNAALIEHIKSVTVNSGQFFLSPGNGSSGSYVTVDSGITLNGTSMIGFYSNTGVTGNNKITVTGAGTTSGWVDGAASSPIVGPWATLGTAVNGQKDYAVFNSDVVTPVNTVASAETTWTTAANAYTLGGATALTATRTITALRYSGAAAALALAGNNLETYGLLNGGTGLLTVSATTGALTTPSGGGNLFLTTGNNAITVSAPINDNGVDAVTLVKSGVNTLTLSSTASTYSGGTVLNAGTLVYTADTNLGTSGSRNITFDGAATLTGYNGSSLNQLTVTNGAVATITAKNITFATTTGSGGIVFTSGNNTLNLGDASAFDGSVTMTAGGNGQTIQFSKMGDAGGCGNLQYAGGSGDGGQSLTMILAGNVAPLTLNNRRIEFLAKPFNWSFLNANLKNNNTTAANKLVINTPLSNYSDRDTNFILGGSNTGDNEFAGVIGDSALGYKYDGVYNSGNNLAVNAILNLQKVDAGTWILSTNNTYSGATTVSAGKLVGVTGGSSSNSAVTVSGGTFSVSVTDITKQWTSKSLTHTAASTLEFAFGASTPSTTMSPLQVNGDIVFAVAPTVSCTGSSLPAGTYPLITWTGVFFGVAPTSLTLTSGTGLLVLDNANKTLWLSISAGGGSTQPLTWQGPSGSDWDVNQSGNTIWKDASLATTYYQETTVNGITVGDSVVFGNTGAGTVTLDTTVSPAAVAVNSTANYTFSGTGVIAGPGGLTKTGSGILTLSTANSYSGGTSLGAGTLSIGINDALGTGPVVLSGGTIQSSDATARTLNNPVVLNGIFTVGGTGDLSFIGTGAGSVPASSTITVNNNNVTFGTALSGPGSITKAGNGKLTFTGTNSYSGTTTLSGGAITVYDGTLSTGGTVSMSANNISISILGGSGVNSTWNLGNQQFGTGNNNYSGLQVLVDGDGVAGSAVLTNVNNLVFGRTAGNSDMIVTDGGQVNVNGDIRIGDTYYNTLGNTTLTIGGGTATSTVTGNNTKSFYIGYGEREGSHDNTVTVTSGGVLTNFGNMFVGHVNNSQGNDQPSTANKLTVTGTGTASGASLSLGYVQSGASPGYKANANVVEVINGGQLSTSSGPNYIGRSALSGSQANSNTVTVTGTGSIWDAGNQALYVGYTSNVSISNVLTVASGGVVTNISTLTVKAANKLSLGAGGAVYAGAVICPGTLEVTIDGGATPPCGRLNVTGNLNLSSATLDVTVAATATEPCVIASYDSLTGGFAVTNGLPSTYKLVMDYGDNSKQIAIVYAAAGTIISFQ